jgi:hypothetical protein
MGVGVLSAELSMKVLHKFIFWTELVGKYPLMFIDEK